MLVRIVEDEPRSLRESFTGKGASMKTHRLLLLTMLVSFIPLRASVIYDTFGSVPPGYTSPSWAIGKFAQFNTQLEVASPFTPNSNYVLDSITIAASVSSGTPYDQLTVYVAAGATAPGAALESFAFTVSGTSVLTATSSAHVSLASGTQYWIVLTAPDLSQTVG
jgi:hypothetical protein